MTPPSGSAVGLPSTIQQRQQEWHRAYLEADSGSLERLLAPDAEVITGLQGRRLSRAAVLTAFRGRPSPNFRWRTESETVRLWGGTALAVATLHEVEWDVRSAYRVSDVFIQIGGEWRLVHSHWVKLPGQYVPVALSETRLQEVAGRYVDSTGALHVVTVRGDHLAIELPTPAGRRVTFEFWPATPVHFFRPGDILEYAFVPATGRAAGAVFLTPLGNRVLQRVDTTVDLGRVERDLTGDGTPEILRLVGVGRTVDSLDVTFTIEAGGTALFRTRLAPLTRTVGFDGAREVLSSEAHQARLTQFGSWFFDARKFLSPAEFIAELRRTAPGLVADIPEVVARGRAAAESRSGAAIWEEISRAPVTIFTFSRGGDGLSAIGWSPVAGRFFQLIECC